MHTDVRVKRVKKWASSLHTTITTIKNLSNKHGDTVEISWECMNRTEILRLLAGKQSRSADESP